MKTFMSFFTAVIVTVLIAIACSKSDKSVSVNKESAQGWKESEKKEFLSDCIGSMDKSITKGKASVYCECMMEKIMTKYPKYSQTVGRSRDEFNDMIDSCDKKAGIEGYD
jgi:hypothetical protein